MIDAATITKVLGSYGANVAANWPVIVAALSKIGIDTPMVEIAAAATVMVETAIFAPITERMADPARQPELFKRQMEYHPYIGRGFVQITWESNYRRFSLSVGANLIRHPELACEPLIAAAILAEFFKEKRIHEAANREEWRRVRRLVNGGYAKWEEFRGYIKALGGSV